MKTESGSPAESLVKAVHLFKAVKFLAVSALLRRYLGSVGGMLWSLLNPLSMILIYWLAFSIFLRVSIDNYFLWLVSGLLPWTFLTTSCNTAINSFLIREGIIQATTVNKLTFVLADVSVELLHLLIAFVVLIVVAAVTTRVPGLELLWLPVVAAPLVLSTYGFAVAFAYLAVRLRDTGYLLGIFFSLSFWLTPIVYHWGAVPEPFGALVRYNPLSLLISPIQVLIHGAVAPSLSLLAAAYSIAAASICLGVAAYRKFDRDIIYYF